MENNNEIRFDPLTGEPINNTPAPNTKKGISPKIVIAALVVIGVAAFAAVSGGLFMSNTDKVLLAITNTFEGKTKLVENISLLKDIEMDNATVKIETAIGDEALDIKIASDKSKKQISGYYESFFFSGIDFIATIDDKKLKVQVPTFLDTVFVYNFSDDKYGYITELLTEEDLDTIDQTLSLISSSKDHNNIKEQVKNLVVETTRALEFEEIDCKKYKVGNEKKECNGYSVTIDKDFYMDILDGIEDIYRENYEFDGDIGEEIDMAMDQLRQELKTIPEFDLDFYIYKKRLAAVNLVMDENELEVLFKGDEIAWADMEIAANDETILEFEAKTKNDKEKYQFTIFGETINIQYDIETCEYEITSDYFYGDTEIYGLVTPVKNGLNATWNLDDGYSQIEANITATSGADFQQFNGMEVDVCSITEEIYNEMLTEVYSALWN